MSVDANTRRKTLRLLSNGMYVITARSGDHYGGATVTWLSQASFKPPLIMAAVRMDSNVFTCLSESGVAVVHILGHAQQDLARKFFSPTTTSDGMMNGEPYIDGVTSAPILLNAPAYVECRVRRIVDEVGDHAVVMMEALEAECREDVRPLTIAESPCEYGG